MPLTDHADVQPSNTSTLEVTIGLASPFTSDLPLRCINFSVMEIPDDLRPKRDSNVKRLVYLVTEFGKWSTE